MVVATFRGRFEDFDATLDRRRGRHAAPPAPSTPARSSSRTRTSPAHLQSPDFFDTERHPSSRFDSDADPPPTATSSCVDGELTIKGNTQPVEARGTITDPHEDTLGDIDKVGLELEAIIDRTEFGLNWNAPLPKGGFALANDVKLIGRARARARGVAAMRVLGISGSPARGTRTTRGSSGRRRDCCRPGPSWSMFDGLKAIPPFDEDDEHRARAGRGRGAARRRSPPPTPCWSRRPSTTARSRACSRTRSTGPRARSPRAPLRNKPAAVDRRHAPACSAPSGRRPRRARCSRPSAPG